MIDKLLCNYMAIKCFLNVLETSLLPYKNPEVKFCKTVPIKNNFNRTKNTKYYEYRLFSLIHLEIVCHCFFTHALSAFGCIDQNN